MNQNKIDVSIVTVAYNCGSAIEKTIKSIIQQSYNSFEYIVIDGGSQDNTLDIIKKYEEKITFWISEKDKGIFDAMNKSLKYVNGQYVIFINAGDRFVSPGILSDVFKNQSFDEDLIFGDVYIENNLGYKLNIAKPIYLKKATVKDYVFEGQGICHQSIFTKSMVLKEVGFNVKYVLGADYDTTARVFNTGNHKIKYLGFPVAIFDDTQGGASHNQVKRVLLERALMFDYPMGINFYLIVFKRVFIQKFKAFLGVLFNSFVIRHRSKKYIKNI